jgi:tetratricopeptide (TPR) repeat protein
MQNKLTFLFLLITTFTFAQIDGYWDKERATSKQVVVSARDRLIIPVEELPIGTTEIVYRITLLDENQQLSNSLVSILKAIPDPTGISQGSAGAVFLFSKITGDDKCKYALFTSKENALEYKKDGKIDKACLYQKEPINKDAKRITLDKTTCFKTNAMWFGFESKNWILNQKIILEVVPWVDVKASRGWNVAHKQEVISVIKNNYIYKALNKKEAFIACYLEAITTKYTYKEYKSLLSIELKKESDTIIEVCVQQTGETVKLVNLIRDKAMKAFESGKFAEAIAIVQNEIIDANKAVAMDYFTLGDFYLLTKQFIKAEETYNKGIAIDPNEINLKLELAHLYLFTDRLSQAKEIHKTYKDYNVFPTISWKEQVEFDFGEFKKYGLPTKNFKKILRILK